jgi:cytochrome c553
MINAIIAGEVDHKSELTGLSEEDIKKLSAYFASQ